MYIGTNIYIRCDALASTSCLQLANTKFIIAIMSSRSSEAKESWYLGSMYTKVASSPVDRVCLHVDARYVPTGPATLKCSIMLILSNRFT